MRLDPEFGISIIHRSRVSSVTGSAVQWICAGTDEALIFPMHGYIIGQVKQRDTVALLAFNKFTRCLVGSAVLIFYIHFLWMFKELVYFGVGVIPAYSAMLVGCYPLS